MGGACVVEVVGRLVMIPVVVVVVGVVVVAIENKGKKIKRNFKILLEEEVEHNAIERVLNI